MSIPNKIITVGALLTALLITSCDWTVSSSEYMYFGDELWGTWVSTNPKAAVIAVINTDLPHGVPQRAQQKAAKGGVAAL